MAAVTPKRHLLLCLLAGLVAAAGHAPLYMWWLALAGWGLALWQMRRARGPWQAFRIGWVVGFGYVAATHFWIVSPFFVDAARHGWMAPFALVAMVAGIALFFGAGFGLAYVLGNDRCTRVLALVPALALCELGRAYLLTGFPWALIGGLWIGQPVMQLAALAGPHGMVIFTLFLVALPMAMAGRARVVAAAVSAVLVLAAMLWGQQRLAVPLPETGKYVRIVQPNAAQHLKWRRDMVDVFFTRALDLSAAPARVPLSLIVWPETTVAYGYDPEGPAHAMIAEAAEGVPLLFGVQRQGDSRWYNSLALIGAGGQAAGVYDKYHLVPFGEYVPYGDLLGRLGFSSFAAQAGNGYSSGPGAELLDIGGLGRALPLICYEAIFPQDVGAARERADFIVHATNDAWFSGTQMPLQHLDQTRMRAIEQGLPVLRAANTGISAVIDPMGRVTGRIEYGVAGYLDVALPVALPVTWYARIGDWGAFAMVLLWLGGATIRRCRFRL